MLFKYKKSSWLIGWATIVNSREVRKIYCEFNFIGIVVLPVFILIVEIMTKGSLKLFTTMLPLLLITLVCFNVWFFVASAFSFREWRLVSNKSDLPKYRTFDQFFVEYPIDLGMSNLHKFLPIRRLPYLVLVFVFIFMITIANVFMAILFLN